MKKKSKNEKKDWRSFSLIISVSINLGVFFFVTSLTELMYETNDDYAISEMIANAYPYIGFVNYYLSKLLILIQHYCLNFNIFILSQISISFISFTALLDVIIKRSNSYVEPVLSTMAILLFAFDHYCFIQFTKTAALLMTAGLILLVDNFTNERKLLSFTIAYLLFFVGVAYRQKGMFPALAFACAFLIIWVLFNFKDYSTGKIARREITIIIVLMVLSVAPYYFDKLSDAANESTAELKLARAYQAERVKITDYPLLDYYDYNAEQYEEVGIDENDLTLIRKFYLDYDGAASFENLKSINKINYNYMISQRSIIGATTKCLKSILKGVKKFSFTGMHIILCLLIAIYMICAKKKGNIVYVIAIGCLAAFIYILLYYQGRPLYRATYIADIGAIFWLLYAITRTEEVESKQFKKSGMVVFICIIIISGFFSHNAMIAMKSQAKYIQKQIETKEVLEYFNDNRDSVFVIPTGAQRNQEAYLDPLKVPVNLQNVTGTGGWQTLSPFKMDSLRRQGIENPIKDMIDNPKVYLVGDYKKKSLIKYLNKWYCKETEEIACVKVDEVGEYNIYQIKRVHK